MFLGVGLQLQPAAGTQVLQTACCLQTAHAEVTRWDCSYRKVIVCGGEVRYLQDENGGRIPQPPRPQFITDRGRPTGGENNHLVDK